ncbi:MAG: MarR family transcriptional regulator [Leptolyngbya sp. SIO3F4]|nr:MarR family transcriptional regulator [Leptolyngbya sp. SIO3F4]
MQTEQQDFLHELGYLGFTMRLKRLSDKLMHDGRKFYESLGLPIEPNWYGVFLLLETHERMGVMQLADHLQMAHPSVITILRNMEKAGFVQTEKDASDQRKRQVSLTPQAKEQLKAFKQVWSAGTESVKQLIGKTHLFADLEQLEARFAAQGFGARAAEARQGISTAADDLQIVPFSEAYAADFSRINYEWLDMYFYIEPYDYEVLDHPKKYIIDPGGEIFFALCDGIVVGTAALIVRDPDTYELSKMGVVPMYKGRKIGVKLMEHAIEAAREQGKKRIYLDSSRKLTPALSLYRKMGFEEIPVDPDTPYARCDIRMEMWL